MLSSSFDLPKSVYWQIKLDEFFKPQKDVFMSSPTNFDYFNRAGQVGAGRLEPTGQDPYDVDMRVMGPEDAPPKDEWFSIGCTIVPITVSIFTKC
jgi:hypothetical protein